ncbi:hypothetical protein [uncultured Brevundimonas sp.]|uniref:hypothetical protein n=1 Tax=uncultured Brevundimonas sp. TaxID=213418 RepID=UPI00262F3CE5|nr:hypothetical protein [uncultured Brevundimonas sp.]
MAVARRLEMERETLLEEIAVSGAVAIDRKKFIFLGGGRNMSRAVTEAWLESWREYVVDEKATLQFLETRLGLVLLWDKSGVERGPKDLAAL